MRPARYAAQTWGILRQHFTTFNRKPASAEDTPVRCLTIVLADNMPSVVHRFLISIRSINSTWPASTRRDTCSSRSNSRFASAAVSGNRPHLEPLQQPSQGSHQQPTHHHQPKQRLCPYRSLCSPLISYINTTVQLFVSSHPNPTKPQFLHTNRHHNIGQQSDIATGCAKHPTQGPGAATAHVASATS